MIVRIDSRKLQQTVTDALKVEVDVEDTNGDRYLITVEHDPEAGEDGEFRVLLDDECLWSLIVGRESDA